VFPDYGIMKAVFVCLNEEKYRYRRKEKICIVKLRRGQERERDSNV